jgi:hypothetical protein
VDLVDQPNQLLIDTKIQLDLAQLFPHFVWSKKSEFIKTDRSDFRLNVSSIKLNAVQYDQATS